MKKKDGKIVPLNAPQRRLYDAVREKDENVIGQRIREARRRKGLSITGFSRLMAEYGVEVTVNNAGKWELGYNVPNAYQLVAICRALDIEEKITYFTSAYTPVLNDLGMRKIEEYKEDLIASGRYRPVLPQPEEIRYIDMPVSNLAVSAGTGNFLDDGNFEMVSFPEESVPAGADFGIRVSGDSMEPVYHDGEYVWVHACEEIAVGQVGVFIYDGEGYLKKYSERIPEGEEAEELMDDEGNVYPQPVLLSYNPKYEPRVIRPGMGFRVVGRALKSK